MAIDACNTMKYLSGACVRPDIVEPATKAARWEEKERKKKFNQTKPNRTEQRVERLSCTHATFFSFVTYVLQIVMSFLLALLYDLEMNDIYLYVNYTTRTSCSDELNQLGICVVL